MIDIADLDVIFLSYNEPNKEHNWADLRSKCPWAKRVDGVEGSDAAHKAAGEASSTERFVLIDGDNIVNPSSDTQKALARGAQGTHKRGDRPRLPRLEPGRSVCVSRPTPSRLNSSV